MSALADAMVGLVALLHILFLIAEMFLWKSFLGRAFGLSREVTEATAPLAANQGLYNGFLAAGLIWSLFPGPCSAELRTFFLICVLVAGLFGGFTASRRIFFIQALPAAAALALHAA